METLLNAATRRAYAAVGRPEAAAGLTRWPMTLRGVYRNRRPRWWPLAPAPTGGG